MSALGSLTAQPFEPTSAPPSGTPLSQSALSELTSTPAHTSTPQSTSLSTLTEKPFTPPAKIPTAMDTTTASPYFQAKTSSGAFVGISDKTDTSGTPFLAYRTPGATATTTDMTRVATKFDPRVPQKLDPSMVQNERMSPSISAPIKQALGGNYSDELDHTIALELAGSNNPANLKIEPGRSGGQSAQFDTEENQLAQQVVSGKMSLWDAQYKLASDKASAGDKNSIPFIDGTPAPAPEGSLWQKMVSGASTVFGGAKKIASTAASDALALGSEGYHAWDGFLRQAVLEPLLSAETAAGTASQNVTEALSNPDGTLKNPTQIDWANAGANELKTLSAGLSAVASPGMTPYQVVNAIPVVGHVLDPVNWVFSAAGTVGEGALSITQPLVNALPISETDKKDLNDAISSVGSTIAQFAVGGYIFGRLGKAVEMRANPDTPNIAANIKNLTLNDVKMVVDGTKQFVAQVKAQLPQNMQEAQSGHIQNPFANGEEAPKEDSKDGIVPEWGTQNQYYLNNPFKAQLDEMARTGNFDTKIIQKSSLWEMQQTLKDKPAYLSSGTLSPVEVSNFAKDNNLKIGYTNDNSPVIGKNQTDVDRVISLANDGTKQRELGLALGYTDVGKPSNFEEDGGYIPLTENLPKTPEEAAQRYQQEVIEPAKARGEPTVISADGMKEHYNDFNDANHPTYSKATFQLYQQALKDNPGDVVLTGGGPASAKSEVVVNGLKNRGFKGIIYDSNLSSYDGALNQIETARAANRKVEIYGVTPDLEDARRYSILREAETGKAISDKTFARGHAGFPDVVSKLIENKVIDPSDVHVIDSRAIKTMDSLRGHFAAEAYVKNPYVHLQGLRYNEADVREQFAKGLFDQRTGERLVQQRGVSRESRKTPNKNRANSRSRNDGRGTGGVSDAKERYGTEDPAKLQETISNLQAQAQIGQEQLSLNPASELMKYYGRNDARFENLDSIFARNVGKGRRSASLDAIVQELGFKDVQDAHDAVLQYLDEKEQVGELKKELADARAHFKSLPEHAVPKSQRAGTTRTLGVKDLVQKETGKPVRIIATPEGQMQRNLSNAGIYYSTAQEAGRTLNETQATTFLSPDDIAKAIDRQKALEVKAQQKKSAIDLSRAQWPVKRSLREKILDALYPIKRLPPELKTMALDWQHQLLSAAEEGNKEMAKVPADLNEKMPPDIAVAEYTAIQFGKYTPVRKIFDRLYDYAESRGLDVPYRKNYLPQVYKEPLKEIKAKLIQYMRDNGVDEATAEGYVQGVAQLPVDTAARLKIHPSFEESKVFPTYSVAAKYGLTPRFTNLAELVGNYRYELERSAANKQFVDALVDKGKLLPGNLAPRHWEHVTGNFVKGDLYGEPQLADLINGLYKEPTIYQQIISPLRWLNHTWQRVMLSGAIPYTNVHFWSIGNLIKSWTAGRFQDTIPFVRSNNLEAHAQWFKTNQMYADMAARQGIDLGGRMGSIKRIFTESGKDSGWVGKFGMEFDKAFTDKSFATFMPELYLQTFKDTFQRGITQGMDPVAAENFAGEVTRNFFGMLGTEGRGKAVGTTLGSIFFAPAFREGVLGVLANTGRSVTTELRNPAFYLNRRLFGGMVFTFAMYNLLNKMLNGQYMWQNPPGHEFEIRIPLPGGHNMFMPWMPSFLALPRSLASATFAVAKGDLATAEQQTGNLFGPAVQTTLQILANKNYFGNAIYKTTDTNVQRMEKIAEYVGLQSSHPYIKAVTDMIQKHIPLYQMLSEATTLPFKFSTDASIAQNAFYSSVNTQAGTNAQNVADIAPVYDQVQQLVAAGNKDEAQAMVNKLTDAQYKAYVSYRTKQKSKNTTQGEAQLYPTYKEIQDLVNQGQQAKAQAMVDNLTDAQYKDYVLLKKRFPQTQ